MDGVFSRTQGLIGKENLYKLKNAKVLLFGIGGVGGFIAEALVRSGIGHLTVVDNDKVDISNFNRQIIADDKTLGRDKVVVARERFLSINSELDFKGIKCFYLPDTSSQIDFGGYDYVIDAIDTVSGKIEIIEQARKANVKVISSMGTGGKLQPELLKVGDISKTRVCPLARVMRRELSKRGITDVKVVYSEEESNSISGKNEDDARTAKVPASMIFVPATAGILIAKTVVEDLIKN